MAVLSGSKILSLCKKLPSDPNGLVITPLLDPKAIGVDSIDLRLGTHFLMPQVPPQPYVDQSSPEATARSYFRMHTPLGEYFALSAHQTVLGATLEYLKFPFNVSGQILTKSSIARNFMVIETARWIHPSYRGCLTLEIANVSNTTILHYPGTPIGQLILMDADVSEAPEKLSGSYIGPVFPEAPVLRSPEQELGRVGIKQYRHPTQGWIEPERMQREVATVIARLNDGERESGSWRSDGRRDWD